MLSIGTLIWIACKPLIRLSVCVVCGIFVTKADIFPLVATKSTSQILLNIAYPCLLFSKIVPSFTAENLQALGPLVVVALVYEIIGILLGLMIKQFFWVPHRFRYGIVLAGGFGNVGDLPTAVALSVTTSLPFNGTTDQNLSIAYISAFILVFVITLFPMGLHKLILWDFVGPDVEPEEVKAAITRNRRAMFARFRKLRGTPDVADKDMEGGAATESMEKQVVDEMVVEDGGLNQVSFTDDRVTVSPILTEQRSLDTGGGITEKRSFEQTTAETVNGADLETNGTVSPNYSTSVRSGQRRGHCHFLSRKSVGNFLKSFFSPVSVSIFVAFPIAIVPQLKALFVHIPGGAYVSAAPDGQPPLAFVMDVISFIGNAAIPWALICLGSSLARLHIPKRGQWHKLPLGAIGSLAIGRLLLMPVIGVLMCEGLTKVGFISKDDKVLRFVCIFCSCLPTATTQVFLTQAYSGTGNAEDVSVFLIPQYILMFFTMTTITAYALHLLS